MFADEEGVEPTNNVAERALRSAALWRKGSFGIQSDAGARCVERLPTVVATCKQQGHDVLAHLTDACAAALHGQPAPSLLPTAALPPPSPSERLHFTRLRRRGTDTDTGAACSLRGA